MELIRCNRCWKELNEEAAKYVPVHILNVDCNHKNPMGGTMLHFCLDCVEEFKRFIEGCSIEESYRRGPRV